MEESTVEETTAATVDADATPTAPGENDGSQRRGRASQRKRGVHRADGSCPGAGCDWHTQEEAMAHLRAVAAQIDRLDGDIINLAEVVRTSQALHDDTVMGLAVVDERSAH